MEQIILNGIKLEELLKQFEEIIDKKLSNSNASGKENQNVYLSRNDVAKLLKVTLPTISDWTKQGFLQSYKIGNRVLFKYSDIEIALSKLSSFKNKRSSL